MADNRHDEALAIVAMHVAWMAASNALYVDDVDRGDYQYLNEAEWDDVRDRASDEIRWLKPNDPAFDAAVDFLTPTGGDPS